MSHFGKCILDTKGYDTGQQICSNSVTGLLGQPFWSWSKSEKYGIQDYCWKCTSIAADSLQLLWLCWWLNAGIRLNFFLLFTIFEIRVIWTVRECYGSSSSRWKGVLGSHQWHCCTCHPGCFAPGSAVALPSQTEGETEQHTNCLLFNQPHCQLWIRNSR